MATLSSVMSIFSRSNQGTKNSPLLDNVGDKGAGNPSPGKTEENQQSSGSPLAKFDKMWEAPTGTDGKVVEPPNPSMIPPLNVDVAKLTEASNKLDFSGSVTDEQLAAAFGPQADKAAIKAVLNSVGRSGWVQGTASTAEITRQSLTHAQAALKDTVLPDAVRNANVNAEVFKENPIFQNPAAAPMLDAVKNQLSLKYPQATPTEIAGMAKEYVSGFARTVVAGEGGTVVDKQKPGEGENMLNRPPADWEKFFGVNVNEQGQLSRRT